MSISTITKRALGLAADAGKATLSALYPNDFEVYLCSLELTDSVGNTIDMITFPVMPDSISKTEMKRTNIKQTAAGITALTSSAYTQSEINLSGNFGKSFKISITNPTQSKAGVAWGTISGKYDSSQIGKRSLPTLLTPAFDLTIKTGYGAIRLLRAILDKSNGVDDQGKPFKLLFYNLAFGESHLVLVPPAGVTFYQDMGYNMVWSYDITLIAVAPLEAVKNDVTGSSLVQTLATALVQKTVNDVARSVSSKILAGI